MTDATRPDPVAGADWPAELIDENGRVTLDTRCRVCRYMLRTRPLDGECPECGTAVTASLRADLLAVADDAWLRRGRLGLLLALVTWLSAIPFAALWYLVDRADAAGRIGAVGAAASNLALWATHGGILAVAVWLMTTPEPGHAERICAARRVARIGIEASLFVSFGTTVASELASLAGPQPLTVGNFMTSTIFLSVNVITMALSLVGWFAMFLYGTSIARRMPHDRLVRWTRIVMSVYVISQSLALAAMTSRTTLNELIYRGISVSKPLNTGTELVDDLTMVLGPITAIGGLVIMVWFFITLRRV